MSSNPLKSNDYFESNIIKYLFEDEYYYDKVIGEIKPDFFRNKLTKHIVKLLKKYHDSFRRMPSYDDILVNVTNNEVNNKILEIKKSSLITHDKMIEETENFVRTNIAYNYIMNNIENIEEYNDFENINKFLNGFKETSDKITSFNISDNSDTLSIGDFSRYSEEYQSTLKEEYRITSGFSIFDKWLQGGFQKKKLSLYFAPSHVGKTMIMFNNAASAYLDGKVVLYLTLEIDKFEAYTRLASYLTKKETIYIEDINNKKEINKLINNIDNTTKGKLLIEEFPTRVLTVSKLESYLEDFRDKHKCYPDIMFIDYLQIMGSPDNVSLYEKGSYLTDGVRRIASEKEIAVVSAVQLGRDASKKANPDESSVSESKYYFDGSDNVLIMSRIKDVDGLDTESVKFAIRKNRQAGIINKATELKSIPSIQTFEEKKSKLSE